MSETVEVQQEAFLPEWLARAWQHYGKARSFDLDMEYWLSEYPNLLDLIDASNGSLFKALSVPGTMLDDGKTPALTTIGLMPRTLEQLKAATREKPGPKTHERQITLATGEKVDLRNRANFDLVEADPRDVDNVARSYLHQFRTRPTKRQRRRLIIELHRVMLLKGQQLSRSLYGSICLRLGMELPPYFWHLPREMLLPQNMRETAGSVCGDVGM